MCEKHCLILFTCVQVGFGGTHGDQSLGLVSVSHVVGQFHLVVVEDLEYPFIISGVQQAAVVNCGVHLLAAVALGLSRTALSG